MSKEHRLRTSRQRVAILEDLRSTTSHPTAEEIYERVKKRLPKISLGTVYRNLELLEATGEIQTVPSGGERRRYDGNSAEHPHIRCSECGRVEDIHAPVEFTALSKDAVLGYEVRSCVLEFIGTCPDCQRNLNFSE